MRFRSFLSVLVGFFLLAGAVSSFAFEPAKRITDREIVERLSRLEAGHDALNKRIDDLSAKLESGQTALNKRIDDLSAKLEASQITLNKRIDDLRAEMKAGQALLNKRIDDLRADMRAGQAALNKRIDNLLYIMLTLFGAIITLLVAIFGYIAWDRRTMIRPVLERLDHLEKVVNSKISPASQPT